MTEAEFEAAAEKHRPMLVKFAREIVGDDAEDAVQDAMIGLWLASGRFEERKWRVSREAAIAGWMLVAVTRHTINILRRRVVRSDVEGAWATVHHLQGETSSAAALDPQRDLLKAMGDFKPADRALILALYDGDSLLQVTDGEVTAEYYRLYRRLAGLVPLLRERLARYAPPRQEEDDVAA